MSEDAVNEVHCNPRLPSHLGVKCWIVDHAVDKHPEVVLDHEWAHFKLCTLVLALAAAFGHALCNCPADTTPSTSLTVYLCKSIASHALATPM